MTTIAFLAPILALVIVFVGLKWASDTTWPINRLPGITTRLAERCPDGQLTAVTLERSQAGVQCVMDGRRHMFTWHRGRVVETTLRPIAGHHTFTLTDFDLEAAAGVISTKRADKVTVTATEAPGRPTAVLSLPSGEERRAGPDMQEP